LLINKNILAWVCGVYVWPGCVEFTV
jgi:hypothetical protein